VTPLDWQKRTKTCLLLVAIFTLAISLSLQTQRAEALIPNIVSVVPWTSGTDAWLNITINHVGSPIPIGPDHYVSIVELNINGTIHDLNQNPQSTETFIVQYDMGTISSPVTVRARAYCNIHGWGAWSNAITVPEYTLPWLTLLLVASCLLVVAMKFKLGVSSRQRRSSVNGQLRSYVAPRLVYFKT
jgi:desulfoferrodoxin (superoxide reductase-like protein)